MNAFTNSKSERGQYRRRREDRLVSETTPWPVRSAVPADRERLRDIFRAAALSNEGDREALRAHPDELVWGDEPIDEGRTRVAVAPDGTLVGFHSLLDTADALELEDLFVDPAWMRRGIATTLIADAVATTRERGFTRLDVMGNPHALAFYESVGFVVDGEITTPFGTPAWCMHLDLRADP